MTGSIGRRAPAGMVGRRCTAHAMQCQALAGTSLAPTRPGGWRNRGASRPLLIRGGDLRLLVRMYEKRSHALKGPDPATLLW
jgi:hypothetical protein